MISIALLLVFLLSNSIEVIAFQNTPSFLWITKSSSSSSSHHILSKNKDNSRKIAFWMNNDKNANNNKDNESSEEEYDRFMREESELQLQQQRQLDATRAKEIDDEEEENQSFTGGEEVTEEERLKINKKCIEESIEAMSNDESKIAEERRGLTGLVEDLRMVAMESKQFEKVYQDTERLLSDIIQKEQLVTSQMNIAQENLKQVVQQLEMQSISGEDEAITLTDGLKDEKAACRTRRKGNKGTAADRIKVDRMVAERMNKFATTFNAASSTSEEEKRPIQKVNGRRGKKRKTTSSTTTTADDTYYETVEDEKRLAVEKRNVAGEARIKLEAKRVAAEKAEAEQIAAKEKAAQQQQARRIAEEDKKMRLIAKQKAQVEKNTMKIAAEENSISEQNQQAIEKAEANQKDAERAIERAKNNEEICFEKVMDLEEKINLWESNENNRSKEIERLDFVKRNAKSVIEEKAFEERTLQNKSKEKRKVTEEKRSAELLLEQTRIEADEAADEAKIAVENKLALDEEREERFAEWNAAEEARIEKEQILVGIKDSSKQLVDNLGSVAKRAGIKASIDVELEGNSNIYKQLGEDFNYIGPTENKNDVSKRLAAEQKTKNDVSKRLAAEQETKNDVSKRLAAEQEIKNDVSKRLAAEQETERVAREKAVEEARYFADEKRLAAEKKEEAIKASIDVELGGNNNIYKQLGKDYNYNGPTEDDNKIVSKRLAAEQETERLAKEKAVDEARYFAEIKRLAAEKKEETERIATEKAAEEAKLAEEKCLTAEKAETERVAKEKAVKEARLAYEIKVTEDKRVATEKEEERLRLTATERAVVDDAKNNEQISFDFPSEQNENEKAAYEDRLKEGKLTAADQTKVDRIVAERIAAVQAKFSGYKTGSPFTSTGDKSEKTTRISVEGSRVRMKEERGLSPKKETERLAEEKAVDEARYYAEEKRLAAEKKEEAERIATEKAAEEAKLAEEKRLSAEKAETERVAKEKAVEEARLAYEIKVTEDKRVATEKEGERLRLAATERAVVDDAKNNEQISFDFPSEQNENEKAAYEDRLKEGKLTADDQTKVDRIVAERIAAVQAKFSGYKTGSPFTSTRGKSEKTVGISGGRGVAEEARMNEEKRLAASKETERVAKEKAATEEARFVAEEKRLAAEKKAETKRIATQKVAEESKLAEEKRLTAEKAESVAKEEVVEEAHLVDDNVGVVAERLAPMKASIDAELGENNKIYMQAGEYYNHNGPIEDDTRAFSNDFKFETGKGLNVQEKVESEGTMKAAVDLVDAERSENVDDTKVTEDKSLVAEKEKERLRLSATELADVDDSKNNEQISLDFPSEESETEKANYEERLKEGKLTAADQTKVDRVVAERIAAVQAKFSGYKTGSPFTSTGDKSEKTVGISGGRGVAKEARINEEKRLAASKETERVAKKKAAEEARFVEEKKRLTAEKSTEAGRIATQKATEEAIAVVDDAKNIEHKSLDPTSEGNEAEKADYEARPKEEKLTAAQTKIDRIVAERIAAAQAKYSGGYNTGNPFSSTGDTSEKTTRISVDGGKVRMNEEKGLAASKEMKRLATEKKTIFERNATDKATEETRAVVDVVSYSDEEVRIEAQRATEIARNTEELCLGKTKDEDERLTMLKNDEYDRIAELNRLNLARVDVETIIVERATEKVRILEEKKFLDEIVNKARIATRKASKDGYNVQKYKYLDEVKSEAERTVKQIADEERKNANEQRLAENILKETKIQAEKAAEDVKDAKETRLRAKEERIAEWEAAKTTRISKEKVVVLLEEKRIAKEKATEEARVAEEKRLAAEKKAEAERIAKEKAAVEQARIEKEKRIVAEKKAEAERIAAEKKAEADRIAAEKKVEAERIATEKAAAEEARIANEKRLAAEKIEAARIAKEKAAAEQARIAKEKRMAAEKAEAARIAKEKEIAERPRIEAEKATKIARNAEENCVRAIQAEIERITELNTKEKHVITEMKRLDLAIVDSESILAEKFIAKDRIFEEKQVLREIMERARYAARKIPRNDFSAYKRLNGMKIESERAHNEKAYEERKVTKEIRLAEILLQQSKIGVENASKDAILLEEMRLEVEQAKEERIIEWKYAEETRISKEMILAAMTR